MNQKITTQSNQINHLKLLPKIQETQLYDKITRIQETILSKLSQIKKLRNLNYLCEHTNRIQKGRKKQNFSLEANKNSDSQQYLKLQQPQDVLRYDYKINYYDRFWKLFLMNQNTAWKVNQLYDNLQEIAKVTMEIQKMFIEREKLIKVSELKGNQKLSKQTTKFKRVSSIENDLQQRQRVLCPYLQCEKQYGSQVSQNLHIKLKHNGGNKSERQFYAENLWLKKQNINNQQVAPITLAPGYFQEYGMVTGRISQEQYEEMKKANKWVGGQVDRKLSKKSSSNSSKKATQRSLQIEKSNNDVIE